MNFCALWSTFILQIYHGCVWKYWKNNLRTVWDGKEEWFAILPEYAEYDEISPWTRIMLRGMDQVNLYAFTQPFNIEDTPYLTVALIVIHKAFRSLEIRRHIFFFKFPAIISTWTWYLFFPFLLRQFYITFWLLFDFQKLGLSPINLINI